MARAWQLHRLSKGLFEHDLDARDATPWMGFRPSLPDSLPVIDVACRPGAAGLGHQHLGLTQAAVTAELIVGLAMPVAGPAVPSLRDLSRYRLDRFT